MAYTNRQGISLEVVDFKREMKRIEEEVDRLANFEINERIDYAVEQLRLVTPVDTGEARSGWFSIKEKGLDGTDGGLIVNEVEHIGILNTGTSKQAPAYFIEQVLLTIGVLTPF
jgi:hypothetical protein